jgi:predicted Fe-Mo cluster-binding NifX family protein
MGLKRIRVAFPTKGDKGLEDTVSYVFGRAEYFTVIDLTDGAIDKVEVVKNPATSYEHGAGPIVAKMLADMHVNAVAAREMGPGVSTLLEQSNIERLDVEADTLLKDAVNVVLKYLEARMRSFQI